MRVQTLASVLCALAASVLLIAPAQAQGVCDIAAAAGRPCVVALSTARPLFSSYSGYLFRVQRNSDNATRDIGIVNGQADMNTLNSFCAGTACVFVIVYDQTSYHLNALNQVNAAFAAAGGHPIPPTVQIIIAPGGRQIPYLGNGYNRDGMGFLEAGTRAGLSNNGAMPTGSSPITEYMVSGPFPANSSTDQHHTNCCYEFGDTEAAIADDGRGTMFTLNTLGTLDPNGLTGIDPENGVIWGGTHPNPPFTVIGKTDGVQYFTLEQANGGGDLAPLVTPSDRPAPHCTPSIITFKNAPVSCFALGPLHLEGGLCVGMCGDSMGWGQATGAFIEGAVIAGETSDATDNAIQNNINSFYYGSVPPPQRRHHHRHSGGR